MRKVKLSDMDRFIKIFDCDSNKTVQPGVVMFKVRDVDAQKGIAYKIIEKHNLNLRVVSTGQMAAYHAFEVWEGRQS